MPVFAAEVPLDLLEYQQQLAMCEHFLGEPLYDAERREFLQIRIETYCAPLDTQRNQLGKKYSNQPERLELLKLPE